MRGSIGYDVSIQKVDCQNVYTVGIETERFNVNIYPTRIEMVKLGLRFIWAAIAPRITESRMQ